MTKAKESFQIIVTVAAALLINLAGKYIASRFSLPLWLDSIGTCFIACIYGPVCGAVTGAAVNISYGFFQPLSFAYAIANICIGLAMGKMAEKKYLDTFMGAMTASVFLTIISTSISVVINLLVRGGYTSNLWGDGVYEMLLAVDFNRLIAAVMGEFCVDFVDKTVTVLLIYLLVHCRGKKTLFLGTFALCVCIPATTASASQINDIKNGYFTTVTYSAKDGLLEGAASAIEFTKDGYLWVGTYGGLYQYNGSEFKQRTDFRTVRNVNCLYTDEEGRLWIGTNDGGMSIAINGEIVNTIAEEGGLSSDSVRAIGEDIYGNIYIGTSSSLDVLSMSGGLSVEDTIPQVQYTYSLSTSDEGYTVAVTNSGEAHVIKDRSYLYKLTPPREGELFNCGCFDEDGTLLLGTYSDRIYRCQVTDNGGTLLDEITADGCKVIQSLTVDEEGNIWICADNGIGYIDRRNHFEVFNSGTFRNSVENMRIDYQGNLWFSSSRQGLLKVSKAVFANLYDKAQSQPDVVNAVTCWEGCYYIGTDSGLDVMDDDYHLRKDSVLAEQLQNERVRCLNVSSDGHLWICTTSDGPLLEVFPSGKTRSYSTADGMLTDRHRACIELSDGTIAVAEDGGIDFIKDGEIISCVSPQDGLDSPRVLCLYESGDQILYAGTDGGGVAVIKEKKLDHLVTGKVGLSSGVILRIVGDREGLFIVTGNGISFMDAQGEIRNIDNFPYSNNFDIYIDSEDYLWVLSGVGVYVVPRESMLSGDEIHYALLNSKSGLDGGITANSWRYVSESGQMYLACENGCYMVDTKNYLMGRVLYRVRLDYMASDGVRYTTTRNRTIELPDGNRQLILHPTLLNYTIKEPYVSYYMEGYDSEPTVVSYRELSDITYANLPSGTYTLHLSILDEVTKETLEENTYTIVKPERIFEHIWFKLYFTGVCSVFLIWCSWIIVKKRNDHILIETRHKLEMAETAAALGNETIMTIASTVDAKDLRTSKHSERVAEYSEKMARSLGWSDTDCENIRKMGLLHDIGKIGIPDSVLNKPGKLTDEEYEMMKTHVTKGAEILKNFTAVKDVDLGVKYHHERYDGKGYPSGLAGDDIPIYARIIAIADTFDAMTSNRVYRGRLDKEEVVAEIKRVRGSQFDPDLTDVFLRLIENNTIDMEALYHEH